MAWLRASLAARGVVLVFLALSFLARPALATTAASQNVQITVVTEVAINVSSVAFPTQPVGVASAPQTVVISNRGATTVNYTLSITGAGAAAFSKTDSCNGVLPPAATRQSPGTCGIDLVFTPASAQTYSATFNIIITGGSTYAIGIGGTGISVTQTSLTVNPGGCSITDNASSSTVCSTATLTLSDGTIISESNYQQYGYILNSSETAHFAIDGFNVVTTGQDLCPADHSCDGTFNTTITAQ